MLTSPTFIQHVSAITRGINMPRLTTESARSVEVPVPPTNEQRRIVAKLDALFEKSRAIRDKLDRVSHQLKQIRRSILKIAFSGGLTREWRARYGTSDGARRLEESLLLAHAEAGGHKRGNAAAPTDGVHTLTKNDIPPTWSLIELRDLCKPDKPICYGILKPGPVYLGGVPYIRVADFPNDELRISSIRTTSPGIDAQFKRSKLAPGDLLMSIRGTVGRMCVIPSELDSANITQDSARLSIQSTMNPDYVRYFLKSPGAQRRMDAATKGVAVRGINIGDLRAVQVPVPERAEQDRIVTELNETLAGIQALERLCTSLAQRDDHLRSSTLNMAFRGELVPQDPNDEPASVLLERIRAERVAAGPSSRRTRTKKLTSTT